MDAGFSAGGLDWSAAISASGGLCVYILTFLQQYHPMILYT